MNDTAKKALINLVSKQIVTFIITKIPFLGWGPLSWVLSYFVTKIIRIAVENTILGIEFKAIDLKVDREVKEVKEKIDELIKLPEDALPEKKKELEDEIAKKYIDLINFN